MIAKSNADCQFVDLAPHYDELMEVVPYTHWAEYVLLLWEIHGQHPRRVLDCACGTGNLSLELARHGIDVTGVDLSAPMIEQAQSKIASEVKSKRLQSTALTPQIAQSTAEGQLEFMQGDLTDFDLGRRFDGATCLYDSLNYITEPTDLQRAFERVRAHVKNGGVWIFDLNSEWAFRANLFSQSSRDARKSLHYAWQANFDESTRLCTVSMRFDRMGKDGNTQTFHETHRERAYSLQEIHALLALTGWELLGSYDAYTLNRPHTRSERWFFAARNS